MNIYTVFCTEPRCSNGGENSEITVEGEPVNVVCGGCGAQITEITLVNS